MSVTNPRTIEELEELIDGAVWNDNELDLEELQAELDEAYRLAHEEDNDLRHDEILAQQELEDFAQDGYFENMEACDIL